jgi:hypothetical protein
MLISTHDRCTIRIECAIGSEIIVGVLNETTR